MEADPQELEEMRVLVGFLRVLHGGGQVEFGAAARVDNTSISRYEKGLVLPPRANLERLAAAAGVPVPLLDALLLPTIRAARAARTAGVAETSHDVETAVDSLSLALEEGVRAAVAAFLAELDDAERPEAEAAPSADEERLQLSDLAAIERLCAESAEAAANDPERASELAGLGLEIAQRTPGDPARRCRLEGYCWGFVGNSRRVGSDLAGAEIAFEQAWKLWHAGAAAGPDLVREWRLLDLEASLRRAQRNFSRALELLARAREAAPPEAVGHILLNRAFTLEQAGEIEAALETLREASSLVEKSTELRLHRVLRFNWIVNLCHLGRYVEAEARLPELRELTVKADDEIDLLRVLWLSGRIAAGLGRQDEARSALEHVRQQFVARHNAYNSALVSLELAVLYLDEGCSEEVCTLAEEMLWIFSAHGIHREALAALGIFCQAAATGTATGELAQRLLGYLESARPDPGLRFEGLG